MARKRHLSRIAVMQVLFERAHRPVDLQARLLKNIAELGEADLPFAESVLEGAIALEDELKTVIEQHAPEWTFDRMDPIARCVLLLGTYEILHGNDAPPAVVMNECIDIAKEYGTDETGKFVNGVLNAIAKEMHVPPVRTAVQPARQVSTGGPGGPVRTDIHPGGQPQP